MTAVEIHCAQTARNVLTDEDLEWLIDFITNYLEPQAVNLLLNSFGCFSDAAKNGELGREISLYIYYQKGDDDGNIDHKGIKDALAFVPGDARMVNGELKYCYMLVIDVDSLIKKDGNLKPIRDPKTGKFTLVREGKPIETLKNTMVHEIFHALMDDYNRTGMSGGTNLKDIVTNAAGQFPTKELGERYLALQFPQWFIEGTASAMENVYQFRYDAFQDLRRLQGKDGLNGTGELNPTFTIQLLVDNYVSGHNVNGDFRYYDLTFASGGKDSNDNDIETEASRYVTGYLATLYLCDLASRYNQNYKGSSVRVVDGVTIVDSEKLREGLSSLLTWMHEGSTMDSLISALAPRTQNGTPIYKDTKSFENLFIKGPKTADGNSYEGDADSQEFVNALLSYLLYLDKKLPENEHPNGSILQDFSKRYTSMIDSNKKTSSDTLKIINSNDMTPSTVKNDTAQIGAGKTNPDQPRDKVTAATTTSTPTNSQGEQQGTKLPAAAKTDNASQTDKQTETEKSPQPVEEKAADAVEPEGDSEQQSEQQTEQQDSSLPADEKTDEASNTTSTEQSEAETIAEKPDETTEQSASESTES